MCYIYWLVEFFFIYVSAECEVFDSIC